MSIAFDKRDYRNPLEEDDDENVRESTEEEDDSPPPETTVRRSAGVSYHVILRWDDIQVYCQQNSLPLFENCSSGDLATFLNHYYPCYDN